MTWESRLLAFLDDLELQAQGAFAAERGLEVAERARAEYAEVTLAARLMAALDGEVSLRVAGVGELTGRLARVADGWCLLATPEREWVVALAAVGAARGLPTGAVPAAAWPVTARLGLGSALRRLAEDGEECAVRLRDQTAYVGRLGRVGRDFVEVRSGEYPRLEAPVLVPFAGLAAVHSRTPDGGVG
ncbi:hypothetical protein [Nocardioides donggukensis]|uniref:Uncharacterized protein n=1 Tax=Nocardioides donggukensis TaxID=2774019 RepID=A0A927K766_9ACTN|nr:hypothetical protein [Nocardioides donggukensis]MBD8870263.1 hypothetical protein [Nocardioides donggukensis]